MPNKYVSAQLGILNKRLSINTSTIHYDGLRELVKRKFELNKFENVQSLHDLNNEDDPIKLLNEVFVDSDPHMDAISAEREIRDNNEEAINNNNNNSNASDNYSNATIAKIASSNIPYNCKGEKCDNNTMNDMLTETLGNCYNCEAEGYFDRNLTQTRNNSGTKRRTNKCRHGARCKYGINCHFYHTVREKEIFNAITNNYNNNETAYDLNQIEADVSPTQQNDPNETPEIINTLNINLLNYTTKKNKLTNRKEYLKRNINLIDNIQKQFKEKVNKETKIINNLYKQIEIERIAEADKLKTFKKELEEIKPSNNHSLGQPPTDEIAITDCVNQRLRDAERVQQLSNQASALFNQTNKKVAAIKSRICIMQKGLDKLKESKMEKEREIYINIIKYTNELNKENNIVKNKIINKIIKDILQNKDKNAKVSLQNSTKLPSNQFRQLIVHLLQQLNCKDVYYIIAELNERKCIFKKMIIKNGVSTSKAIKKIIKINTQLLRNKRIIASEQRLKMLKENKTKRDKEMYNNIDKKSQFEEELARKNVNVNHGSKMQQLYNENTSQPEKICIDILNNEHNNNKVILRNNKNTTVIQFKTNIMHLLQELMCKDLYYRIVELDQKACVLYKMKIKHGVNRSKAVKKIIKTNTKALTKELIITGTEKECKMRKITHSQNRLKILNENEVKREKVIDINKLSQQKNNNNELKRNMMKRELECNKNNISQLKASKALMETMWNEFKNNQNEQNELLLNNLQNKIEKIRKTQQNGFNKEIKQYQQEIYALKQQIKSSKFNIKQNEQISILQQQNHMLCMQISDLKQQIKQFKNVINKNMNMDNNNNNKSENTNLQLYNQSLKANIAEHKNEIKELRATMDNQKFGHDNAGKSKLVNALKYQNNESRRKIEELQENIVLLKQELLTSKQTNNTLSDRYESNIQIIESHKTQIKSLRISLSDTQNRESQVIKQLNEIKLQSQKYKIESQQFKSQIIDIKQLNNKLNQQLSYMQNNNNKSDNKQYAKFTKLTRTNKLEIECKNAEQLKLTNKDMHLQIEYLKKEFGIENTVYGIRKQIN